MNDAGRRRFIWLAFLLPAVCIVGAYVWLAIDRRALWLGNVIVHESGRYTLLQTVFYFSHFLREIPVDIAMALFCVMAFAERHGLDARGARRQNLRRVCAFAVLAIAAGAFALESSRSSAGSAWMDLAQYRTRDDVSAYGSHWHYHLASTLWFGTATLLAVGLLSALANLAEPVGRASHRLRFAAWGYFGLLTLIFGVSPLAFTSVLYTGHQARELLTHVPITMMLVFGTLAALEPDSAAVAAPMSAATRIVRALRRSWWQTALALAIPLALALVTASGDPMGEGQAGEGLSAMIGGHVFEHTLDYVFTVLVAIAATGLAFRTRTIER